MKYTIESTIPTVQYGNIRQAIEVESVEQEEEAVSLIKGLWERFGETPLKDKRSGGVAKAGTVVEVTTFTGEKILWDEGNHIYTDMAGNVLLSGSKYADMHSPKFDMQLILPKTAKSWEVNETDLKDIWEMNRDISNYWGSAIHKALEILHKHGATGQHIQEGQTAKGKEMEDNYVMPKNSYLKKIVSEFIAAYGTTALPEVVVSDVANKRAGTIDRLEIIDEAKKLCRIGDYKTNTELDAKKRLKYQKQLSFYAHVLQAHGWTVQGLDIFHLDHNDGWIKEEMEVLDLE